MTDFFIGCAVAVLSGMGVGGGGLLLIFLTLVRDYAITDARVTGLVFFLLSAGASLPYHRTRCAVPWRYVLCLTLCAVPGVVLGNALTQILSPDIIRAVFGWFLMLAGSLGLVRCFGRAKKKNATA